MLRAPAFQLQFRRAESPAVRQDYDHPAEAVRRILSLPEDELDYATAKIALDGLVDSSIDQAEVLRQLGELTASASELVAGNPRPPAKLDSLRRLLHESGEWNGWRPFEYDHSGFKSPAAKLLSHYLAARLGNCVSMPILFLILADRLGLNVALARAPSHLFVRHHPPNGSVTNLETTSGALPARDIWICQTRNVSQRGIEYGGRIFKIPGKGFFYDVATIGQRGTISPFPVYYSDRHFLGSSIAWEWHTHVLYPDTWQLLSGNDKARSNQYDINVVVLWNGGQTVYHSREDPNARASNLNPRENLGFVYTYQDYLVDNARERFGPLNTIGLVAYLIKCVHGDVDTCEGLGPGLVVFSPREVTEDPGTE